MTVGAGRVVVVGISDKEVSLNVGWFTQKEIDVLGTRMPVFTARHDSPVHAASWSPDGKRFVTVSDDRTARVWDSAPFNYEPVAPLEVDKIEIRTGEPFKFRAKVEIKSQVEPKGYTGVELTLLTRDLSSPALTFVGIPKSDLPDTLRELVQQARKNNSNIIELN